jgi:head-tail adaptor
MRFWPASAKLAILRRAVIPGDPGGVARGDFAPIFSTWCTWRNLSAQQIVEAGLAEDAAEVVARVNDNSRNRAISIADRAILRGQQYAIVRVGLPDRAGGFIEIMLSRKTGG